ncbi:sugar phosphate isomerase/epimerase family protein [Ornithinimicrobium cryptoxanthini]|uniref:Sugar phosphate isomerase/epimerase n=1 Tax=Ornithinimicrobium cryptoxanthini TaxID=2934161 RepID=A0ABY4YEZ7_9MICO|nr:sugar phosphate isomerase/epimerase [Ornithinimicrobium cryptoxanthini]USQ75337.1 sugar phosphate isomerase/epimerase [Ornithinimicrobium cryptoxanthini]
MTIDFASQTYSWQMSGAWTGRLGEIAQVVASSGFSGIEFEVVMSDGYETADQVGLLLETNGLKLAALTLVLPWRDAQEKEAERVEADRVIEVVQHFPRSKLVLVQVPFDEPPADRETAQSHLLGCLAGITERAVAGGVSPTFHPNSPRGSIVRTREDYDRVIPRLPKGLGWTPDTGHLAAGGMDPVEMIRLHREKVDHIHLKDADAAGKWVQNGSGAIDMAGAVALLVGTGYRGWVVVEDESPEAERDPNAAAAANGMFVRDVLGPLTDQLA